VSDVERLREALAPVARQARGLSWHKERPWKAESHVWEERGVPTLDLHDLGRKLALLVVDTAAELGPSLDAGAVRLITGRGRHSLTGPVLPRITVERLQEHCDDEGWGFHADGAARLMWVFDPDRAPPAARGTLPWWVILWGLVVVGLAVWVCATRLGA
jgi:hypothetical protein